MYKERINQIRGAVEHTAHALNDGGAAVTVATVGVVSAVPEGLALYLTAVNHISPSFAGTLAFALPAISVGAVYVAVTKQSISMWFVFFGQLLISLMLTVQMGASWEWMLPIATGLGAIVAAVGQSHSSSARMVTERERWERDEKAKDNEAKRQHKYGRTDGQPVPKVSNPERAKHLSAEGLSVADIAGQLGVTDRSVRRYLKKEEPDVHLNGVAHG